MLPWPNWIWQLTSNQPGGGSNPLGSTMSLKIVNKALDLAMAELEQIPKEHFDYSTIMNKCGTSGCIIGHWGHRNNLASYDTYRKGLGAVPISKEFAKYLGVSVDSTLFRVICYGDIVTIDATTIWNNPNYSKAQVLEVLRKVKALVTKENASYLLVEPSEWL